MTDQSRTPRTESNIRYFEEHDRMATIKTPYVPPEFARTLELEAADLRERLAKARADAVEQCWQAVNALIQEGELPQELHERRNGLVLAPNAISALAHPKGEDHGNG